MLPYFHRLRASQGAIRTSTTGHSKSLGARWIVSGVTLLLAFGLLPRAMDYVVGNKEIEFFGKVVGPGSIVISHAVIHATIFGHNRLFIPILWGGGDQKRIDVTITTQSDGRFEITGMTGMQVAINNIDASGFQFLRTSNHEHRADERVFSFDPPPPDTPYRPDPMNPAVFHVY